MINKLKTAENLLVSIGFASSLFLLLPLAVYLLNLDSVTTQKSTIIICGGLLTLVTTVLMSAAMTIHGFGRWVLLACQIGFVTIMLLILFPNRTGELSGFVTFLSSSKNLLPTIKTLLFCCVAVWLAYKKPQLHSLLVRYSIIIVVSLLVYVGVFTTSVTEKTAGSQAPSPAEFTHLGESSNVIVVIFDSFTGYRMAELFAEYPKLRSELDGFTYYPSTLASAFSTPVGISSILTGDLATSLLNADAMERNAVSLQNSFLMDAKRQNLSAGFISLMKTNKTDIPHIRENIFHEQRPLTVINRFPAYLGFFSLSLSRVLPSNIASYVSTVIENISVNIQKSAQTDWELLHSLQSESERRALSGKIAFQYFVDNLAVTKKNASVVVMHSMLTHPPNNITASGKYESDKGSGYDGTSVYAVHELARLCEKLRTLGVYDSSLIIAVADHGGLNVKDKSMGGVFPSSQQLPLEFNPLLMVKAPNSHGPCRTSSMSVWLGDVATTVRDFLGISPNSSSMFTSRSLLQPEIESRVLAVPVFYRPDQVHFYDSLAKWVRYDFKGTFREYGTVLADKVETQLQGKSLVKLFAGEDQLNKGIMRRGWSKEKNIPYKGSIEVNNRLLAKITTNGIVVVTGSKDNGYTTHLFSDVSAGESFIKNIPPHRDCLVVGLKVPVDLPKRLFGSAVAPSNTDKLVGFVSVSGPSYGPVPRTMVSVEDVSLDIAWKP